MRPFRELTPTGRGNRLRGLAADVAQRGFGVEIAALRRISQHSFNTVFRLDGTVRGRTTGTVRWGTTRMVLRVGEPLRIHQDGVEGVEARWLTAIAHDTTLTAPVPVAGADGASTRRWSMPGVDGERVCSLFTWVDGRRLRERLSTDALVAMGRVAAQLHDHAPSVDADGAPAMRSAVYFGNDLVTEYSSPAGAAFAEALERVQTVLDKLWASPPHRPHLLHGDIGPHNILMFRGSARPIDFQDLQLGFEVQDVAITVADLRRTAPDAIEPFRRGYEEVRAWPLDDPALAGALTAARSLNVMNLGLHLRRAGLDRFLDEHSEIVLRWMRGGDSLNPPTSG